MRHRHRVTGTATADDLIQNPDLSNQTVSAASESHREIQWSNLLTGRLLPTPQFSVGPTHSDF